ncbi:conjugative transposon protein TraM [Mucilaginibacter paludis]|uniref:Conjugative transposon TraM protein n=1 Tax=Mucilaginibacter paludis DSM 18603 TaxID=714943 RepID=H1YDU1_9SPHI|nr:conjugative transposon protein TraM [Mucilaginibacter paludis]EHQ24281.1 conjugative transposon TraM protein [Mucilaginibacter paludis DSM 18603]
MQNDIKNKRQLKFLLVLPVLVIPFATLFFWSLGGGANAKAGSNQVATGLNSRLPGAQLKSDSTENKLSFYQQAEKDSAKIKEAIKDDPYYKRYIKDSTVADTVHKSSNRPVGNSLGAGNYHAGLITSSSKGTLGQNEAEINRKLAQLQRQVSQPETATVTAAPQPETATQSQLQAMVQQMNSSKGEDPELKQLSEMLSQIQEIQNPGLARQRLREQSEKNKGLVFAVSPAEAGEGGSLMPGTDTTPANRLLQSNGFFGLQDNNTNSQDNAVPVVIHETQTLTTGATVKMRLLEDLYVGGRLIPKDNFVFGTCSLEGERLTVEVKTIRYQASVYPVSLSVFDQDGLAGLYIPGAITRDAAKQGADQAIQGLDIYSMSPSVGAQAASAGIQAAKGLFSKKAKLVKVTVKAGYGILLVNSNQLSQ